MIHFIYFISVLQFSITDMLFLNFFKVVLNTFEAQPLSDEEGDANNLEESANFSIKYLTSSKLMGLEVGNIGIVVNVFWMTLVWINLDKPIQTLSYFHTFCCSFIIRTVHFPNLFL